MNEVLPDVVRPNAKILFCGTNPSKKSEALGAYYSNPTNIFWLVLAALHYTPRLLKPQEFRSVSDFGIGLTDLSKFTSGSDKDIFLTDADRLRLRELLRTKTPSTLAFTSKTAASFFFNDKRKRGYGPTNEVESVKCYILPSTSVNNFSWDISHWEKLAIELGFIN
jgi:TDG/mug DNA glycosylase family protein